MAFWNRFFGSAASQAAGFAIGGTAVPAFTPAIQYLINEAWERAPDRPMPFALAAQIAAEDRSMEDFMRAQGEQQGIRADKMDQLLHAIRGGPGVALGFELWRRDIIDEAGFDRVLWEEKFEESFHAPLKALKNALLSPADLAALRQRGFIDQARQYLESERQGITNERAERLFELSGLPPGVERAMAMLRRDIFTEAEFKQTIVEGNEKLKYQDEELALRWELATVSALVNLRLRGWIEDAEYHNRMRAHGYQPDVADDLFHAIGRPATVLQMVKGFRRGGRIAGVAPTEEAHVRTSVRQSDIRPEDADLLFAGRESMPSAFVLRRLVEDGAFTRQEAAEILYQNAWRRDIADAAAASWVKGTGTTSKGLTVTDLAAEYEGRYLTRAQYVAGLRELGYTDADAAEKADAEDARRVKTSRDQLVSRTHSQYVAHRISRDKALDILTRADIPARVRNGLLPGWDLEREIVADALTVAQVKKGYAQGRISRDDAVARLEFRGYDEADANLYLDE